MRSLVFAALIASVASAPIALLNNKQHVELQVQDTQSTTAAPAVTTVAATTVATSTGPTNAPANIVFCNAAYTTASTTASITAGKTTASAAYGTCTSVAFDSSVTQGTTFSIGWGGKTNVVTNQLGQLCPIASWNTYVLYPQQTTPLVAVGQVNGGGCTTQLQLSNVRVSYFDAITVSGPQGGVPVNFLVNGKNVFTDSAVDYGAANFIDTTVATAVPSSTTTTLTVTGVSQTTAAPSTYVSFTVNGITVPSTHSSQDVTFIAYGQVGSTVNPPAIMVTPYSAAASLIQSSVVLMFGLIASYFFMSKF